MPDSYDQWDHESYEDEGGTGLLWRTARNAAVLLAGCLLVWGVLKWGGEQVAEISDEPNLVQSPVTPSAPVQISRDTAMGAEIVIPAGRNGHFLVVAEIEEVEILFLVDTGASQSSSRSRMPSAWDIGSIFWNLATVSKPPTGPSRAPRCSCPACGSAIWKSRICALP